MKPCKVESCQRPAGVPGTAWGWCSAHYNRWKRTGDPLTTLSDLKVKPSPTCSVEDCKADRWARGLCGTHYRRLMTTGVVGDAERMTLPATGRCAVGPCRRPARSRGLCHAHYLRRWRHGDPLAGATAQGLHSTCSARTCSRKHYALGLCHGHWTVVSAIAERGRRLGVQIPGNCTPSQLTARIDMFANRCWMCGASADGIDHVKPLRAGGSNWPSNLRPACRACNIRKGARWPHVAQRVDALNKLIGEPMSEPAVTS